MQQNSYEMDQKDSGQTSNDFFQYQLVHEEYYYIEHYYILI